MKYFEEKSGALSADESRVSAARGLTIGAGGLIGCRKGSREGRHLF
jgi:hypothetical protein